MLKRETAANHDGDQQESGNDKLSSHWCSPKHIRSFSAAGYLFWGVWSVLEKGRGYWLVVVDEDGLAIVDGDGLIVIGGGGLAVIEGGGLAINGGELGIGTIACGLTPALPICTEPNGIPVREAPPGAVGDVSAVLLELVLQVSNVAALAGNEVPTVIPPPS